jgi:prepilin-type N-terminal cleavage/methylation domain-containing protein
MKHCRFRIADFGFRIQHLDSIPHSAIRNSQLKGFTLFEVMVAVVIMATVLVSLIGLKNRAMQDVLLAEHITTATTLAKRKMVETITATKGGLKTLEDEGMFTEDELKDKKPFSEYSWKKTVTRLPLPNNKYIFEVRIAVLWKEGTREERVELVSYE